MINKIFTFFLLSSILVIGGCVLHGGHVETIHPPTLGQELIDLKAALDGGIISEQEYMRKKAEITSSPKTTAANHKD